MIQAIISDLSKTLLFRRDDPTLGHLNDYHQQLLQNGDYDFWKYFKLNSKLIKFYKQINKKVPIYIFTSKYIQDYPPLNKKLKEFAKDIFSAAKLKVHKSDPKAYQLISRLLKITPANLIFIDDSPKNISAAKQVGINAILYKNINEVITKLTKLLQPQSPVL